jgi:hypothetical protein
MARSASLEASNECDFLAHIPHAQQQRTAIERQL